MRSDFNLVTNNVDVMNYDVKYLTNKVNNLSSEMVDQQNKTKYLKIKTDQIEIVADVALAFGIAGTVMGGASLGLQFSALGVQTASRTVNGFQKTGGQFQGLLSDISEDVSLDAGSSMLEIIGDGSELHDIPMDPYMRTVKTTTDLTPILEWYNKETTSPLTIKFNSEYDDTDKLVTTINGGMDICNRFRSSLKPTFKAITTRINVIHNDLFQKVN
ncbi:hypothetical protein M9Y10_009229 [Tritrichomonas musculus]|uniref:Uncharacterized protein n=1 Tax=Tritrichomonas musculus TaxID=1915356 RepID=A0ABR2IMR4_9EUKA